MQVSLLENSNYSSKEAPEFSLLNEFLVLLAKMNQFWQKKEWFLERKKTQITVLSLLIDFSIISMKSCVSKETLFLCCHSKI